MRPGKKNQHQEGDARKPANVRHFFFPSDDPMNVMLFLKQPSIAYVAMQQINVKKNSSQFHFTS
jgi:hypothetical protein